MNPIIHDWSIVGCWYEAPEVRKMQISGKVYGDDRFIEGEPITTSVVQASIGNTVETQNTVYDLGRVSEEYLEWCLTNGIVLDPAAPLKL